MSLNPSSARIVPRDVERARLASRFAGRASAGAIEEYNGKFMARDGA